MTPQTFGYELEIKEGRITAYCRDCDHTITIPIPAGRQAFVLTRITVEKKIGEHRRKTHETKERFGYFRNLPETPPAQPKHNLPGTEFPF